MTTAIDTVAPSLKVNGSELSAVDLQAVTLMRVERALCIVGRATLRLRDEDYKFSAGKVFPLGAAVTLGIVGKQPIFNGIVTGVRLEQSGQAAPELVVTADDLGCKLLAGQAPKVYNEQSYEDVLMTLAKNAGLSSEISGAAMGSPAPYLLQTGSPAAYLDAVARRTGSVWWVDDKKLVVRDAGKSSGTVTLSLTKDLINFSVRASALRPTEINVSGWDPKGQATITGAASKSNADTRPTADFVKDYLGAAPQKVVASKPNVASMFPTTQAEAKTIAGAALADAEAAAVVARGTCWVNGDVVPGATVKITEAGPTSGEYYVSEVEHSYDRRGFTTRFVAGPMRPMGLVDTLGGPPPDPGIENVGLVVGVVSDNKDPDNSYRVKVKLPGLQGEVVSFWARVISLGAGGQRGMSFLPEVEDEVLVGFEFGDQRRPVVLGSLYSSKNALPKANQILANGKVSYRRMTSRLGHVIEFGDGSNPNTQHVLIQLADGNHTVRLGKDQTDVEIPSGEQLSIKAGESSFVIDQQGNITIKGKKITIQAQLDLVLEGMNVSAKANTKLEVQGNAMVDVKSNGLANVQASGPLALKGAMVNIN
jgi:phage baseplate assembly protein gpV